MIHFYYMIHILVSVFDNVLGLLIFIFNKKEIAELIVSKVQCGV